MRDVFIDAVGAGKPTILCVHTAERVDEKEQDAVIVLSKHYAVDHRIEEHKLIGSETWYYSGHHCRFVI